MSSKDVTPLFNKYFTASCFDENVFPSNSILASSSFTFIFPTSGFLITLTISFNIVFKGTPDVSTVKSGFFFLEIQISIESQDNDLSLVIQLNLIQLLF